MAASKKTKPSTTAEQAPIDITWDLAELPTAQHRAGLAGLVMLVQWVHRGGAKSGGILELPRLDATGVTLRTDRGGLRCLYDSAYAATVEDKVEATKRKNKKGAEVPPKREETQESVDPKTGKTKTKKVFVYDTTVPRGAFLLDEDSTKNGSNGLWIKLWRDFVWSIVRGVPATRGPYESRAEGDFSADADEALAMLARGGRKAQTLAGPYYLGAQECTADGVPFEDQERFKFLLQFWPFAVSLYVPAVVDAREGTRKFDGSYVVAVPDVSQLDLFCSAHIEVLRNRSPKARGYRPEAAAIDLPIEGGLHAAAHLRERISRREGAQLTGLVVAGYEVVHMAREGNNIRVLRASRVEPSDDVLDRYLVFESRFGEHFFRRQQIANLLDRRPWWHGFDRLFETLPHTQFIGRTGRFFGSDARKAFEDNQSAHAREEGSMSDAERKPPTLESVVQRVVWTYATGRVKARTGLTYDAVKERANPAEVARFNEELERATRDAFLAVRSRSGRDFGDYFAGTICSVRQRVGGSGYELLARALLDEHRIAEVRTLTMLALSTVSGVYDKKSDGN